VFKCGDALAYADATDGTYDLVMLGHNTADYIHGFGLVRDLVAPGGAILTDNVAV
jgi:predicted O-methyltransferase YrrM